MRITNSTSDDTKRLCELNDACFEGLERPPHEDFKSMMSVSEVWVARVEHDGKMFDPVRDAAILDEVVGYIIVKRTYGAYLWSIGVDPLYRGRGVAGYLMSHAEQFCKSKGDDSIRLHCQVTNPSQKLYFDHGYRVYDLAHGYYGDGSIALMMKKGLK